MDTKNRCRILEGFSSTTARRTMITWFLLVTLFCKSTQGGNADENSVSLCEPQNLTLNSSKQTILLTWEDDPSCSAVNGTVVYELLVLAADCPQHYDEVPVTPEQAGVVHAWSWTSPLALECASHSVRISSRYKNQKSSWTLERTLQALAGNVLEAVIFPEDGVFHVGSTVTFCCVLPPGAHMRRMYVQGYNDADAKITRISNQTHALTVLLDRPSKDSCTNVYCVTETATGTCVYVDYIPTDQNLQCETRDLKSVECRWTVGKNTHLRKTKRFYWLQGRICENGHKGRCSIDSVVNATVTTWTLVVQNQLGTVKLTDMADMTQRVYMLAPDVDVSHVNARNVCLTWRWREQYYTKLNISCQVNVSSGETSVISETFGHSAVLIDLIPNWSYTATVRCATEKHVWKWGDWSPRVNFHTKGDVPDPLDVWMQMKKNQVIITWKKLPANESHGNILDYTVTWAKVKGTEQPNSTTVTEGQTVGLSVDTSEAYTVNVTARNSNGSSSTRSSITIPPWNPDRTGVNTSRISGSDGGFSLRWSASPKAACGYVVDWCPTSGNCTVEWIKVPPRQTKARITSKNFRNGLRYTLSIYACTQRALLLLERREGYVQEEKIQDNLFEHLTLTQQDYDMKVSWNPVRLTEQPAFIRGYVLYWLDNNIRTSFYVNTANPEATSLTATKLRINSYEFTVKALTAVGECGTTVRLGTLTSLTDELIKVITISLVTVSSLLLLLSIVCYRHWACIKRKVCPPIPKPELMDKWVTSLGENTCHPLYVDRFLHSEADIMDVPELHVKAGAPVDTFVHLKNEPFVNSQTPKGYYNQPLKRNAPPPRSTPPPSSFTSMFPNRSYNLVMQPGGQQSGSELQPLEGSLESSSSGYQPQTLRETQNNPDGPIPCMSTYILLPHPHSK